MPFYLQPQPGETPTLYKTRAQEFMAFRNYSPGLSFNMCVPHDVEKLNEYLRAFPNERLKYEPCDSAIEVMEMTKLLRAHGALYSSNFANLLQAVVSEGQLTDKLVLENEKKAFTGIKPSEPSTSASPKSSPQRPRLS